MFAFFASGSASIKEAASFIAFAADSVRALTVSVLALLVAALLNR